MLTIKKNIYSLPLEIKIKIYQMAIQKNMFEWNLEHMKNNRKTLEFFTNIPSNYSNENKYSCWNLINDNHHRYYYNYTTIFCTISSTV